MSAIARLQQALKSPDLAHLESAVRELEAGHRDEAFTWYAKAELLRRKGDTAAALAPSATAITALLGPRILTTDGQLRLRDLFAAAMASPPGQLFEAYAYLEQLGDLLERNGITHKLDESLDSLGAAQIDPARTGAFTPVHAQAAAYLLGFNGSCALPWAETVFAKLIVPWLLAAAEAGQFDTAIALENIAYGYHVRRIESQAWFKATTGRWIPGLAQRAREKAAPRGIPHARWRPEPTRRVAFVLHSATLLAHVAVLLETLKAVNEVGARAYDFTVFVLKGRHGEMRRSFEDAGAHVRYLDERSDASHFENLLELQRILREENFAACFWMSLVIAMAVAFPMRIAPLQGWWAMKYHACDLAEIDVHLAMENAVTRKVMEGIEWRTLGTASTDWVDRSKSEAARELRATFPADAVVAAAIGREEKLDSPEFLAAVSRLMKKHPKLFFLWTGKAPRASIVSHFEREGVAERARFVGWVDTRLYAQAIDLFLDSFPFPCGFTLKEAMAAGKPAVMYKSAESLETGVVGAITPVIEGPRDDESAPVREQMRSTFTRERDFDLYFCAASPQEYFEYSDRLVTDAALRNAAGEANRRFVAAFLSSPRDEANKFLDHLDQIFSSIPGR